MECISSSNCSNINTPICDESSFTCRQCQSDPECENNPICDAVSGRCIECISSSHCSNPNTPICDSFTYQCRKCQDNTECPSSLLCNIDTGMCGSCFANPDCLATPSTPICDKLAILYQGDVWNALLI